VAAFTRIDTQRVCGSPATDIGSSKRAYFDASLSLRLVIAFCDCGIVAAPRQEWGWGGGSYGGGITWVAAQQAVLNAAVAAAAGRCC